MKHPVRKLAATLAALLLSSYCLTAFALSLDSKASFSIEQVYLNAPQAWAYLYATDDQGKAYSASQAGHAGIQVTLDADELALDSVDSTEDEPITYIYVLDSFRYEDDTNFRAMVRAVKRQASLLKEGDQLLVYKAGAESELIIDPDTDPDEYAWRLNRVEGDQTTPGLTSTILDAAEYVEEHFEELNRRKVLFLVADGNTILRDSSLIGALKETEKLTALGMAMYGYGIFENASILSLLQFVGDFQANLLTSVTAKNLSYTLNQRIDQLHTALVVRSVADKSLMDGTLKTLTVAIPKMKISAQAVTAATHTMSAPSITTVLVRSQNKLQVNFNCSVTNADQPADYRLKNVFGQQVPISEVTVAENGLCAFLTTADLYDGAYTLALRHITDRTDEGNGCSLAAESFEVDKGFEKDAAFYWFVFRKPVLLLALVLLVLILYSETEKRKDRRREVLAQAESQLAGDASDAGIELGMQAPAPSRETLLRAQLPRRSIALLIGMSRSMSYRVDAEIVGSYLIGSSVGLCDLRVDDADISPQQCVLGLDENNRVLLTVVEGAAPTLLNGEAVAEPVTLRNNDEITLGKTKITVKL